MDAILETGVEQILWLQSYASVGLDGFFHYFTQFGGRHYLFMLPLVIWCIDFRVGSRLLMWMSFSLLLNSVLKDAIAQPRPFQLDDRILSAGELGYGLPSGHAQLVVLFWGLLASGFANRWFWALSVVIMFMMALSRVYLGVHFPTDVYAGLLLGAGTLWVAIRYADLLESWLVSLSRTRTVGLLLALSLAVLFVNRASFESGLMTGCAGFVLGAGLGLMTSSRNPQQSGFVGRGPIWQRTLRYCAGMVTLLVLIRVGTLLVENSGKGFASGLVLYALLAVLGLWLTAGGPWLFGVLRLSDAGSEPVAEKANPF